jgi:hypothetical protein
MENKSLTQTKIYTAYNQQGQLVASIPATSLAAAKKEYRRYYGSPAGLTWR